MTYSELFKELEKKVEEDYGPRCKNQVISCSTCIAFLAVDYLAELADIEQWEKRDGPK